MGLSMSSVSGKLDGLVSQKSGAAQASIDAIDPSDPSSLLNAQKSMLEYKTTIETSASINKAIGDASSGVVQKF